MLARAHELCGCLDFPPFVLTAFAPAPPLARRGALRTRATSKAAWEACKGLSGTHTRLDADGHTSTTMSRAAKVTLGVATAVSALTVWGVHYMQVQEREVRAALHSRGGGG